MKNRNKLWFRRKTYGWGWTPITWEGWFVTALVVLIPIAVRLTLKAMGGIPKETQYFYAWATVPLLIMGLTLLCFRFGEKPKWQWGIKRTKLAHLDLKVSNYKKSIQFYDKVLLTLGWTKLVSQKEFTYYTDGTLKLVIRPGLQDKLSLTRLNFLSFYAETKELVDEFHREVLLKNSIEIVNDDKPRGDKSYYYITFKDPDGLVLQYMYSPFYCEKEYSENNLENTFDPYES